MSGPAGTTSAMSDQVTATVFDVREPPLDPRAAVDLIPSNASRNRRAGGRRSLNSRWRRPPAASRLAGRHRRPGHARDAFRRLRRRAGNISLEHRRDRSSIVVRPVATTEYRAVAANGVGPGVEVSRAVPVASTPPAIPTPSALVGGQRGERPGHDAHPARAAGFGVLYFYDPRATPTWASTSGGSGTRATPYSRATSTCPRVRLPENNPALFNAIAKVGTASITFVDADHLVSPRASRRRRLSTEVLNTPLDKKVTPLASTTAPIRPARLRRHVVGRGGENGWGMSLIQSQSTVFARGSRIRRMGGPPGSSSRATPRPASR